MRSRSCVALSAGYIGSQDGRLPLHRLGAAWRPPLLQSGPQSFLTSDGRTSVYSAGAELGLGVVREGACACHVPDLRSVDLWLAWPANRFRRAAAYESDLLWRPSSRGSEQVAACGRRLWHLLGGLPLNRSRCRVHEFSRVQRQEAARHLGVSACQPGLPLIARKHDNPALLLRRAVRVRRGHESVAVVSPAALVAGLARPRMSFRRRNLYCQFDLDRLPVVELARLEANADKLGDYILAGHLLREVDTVWSE